MRKRVMFSGQKYNRWTTITLGAKVSGSMYWWYCECDCGTKRNVRSGDLVNGKSKSCGCLQKEQRKKFDHTEAFWEKIEKTEDCWLWRGARTPMGYGIFKVKNKNNYAHRYAYELTKGKIPETLVIDHLCRRPSCVNPDHLEPVTIGENVLRGVIVRRRNHCENGHALIPINVYVNPTTGKRRCKTCRNFYRRKYWLEKHDNRML